MSSVNKKQRFQVGFDLLFTNAATNNSSMLALLIASTGSLIQKYSGPDAISVPMEVLIRYGENQDKFELLFQIFDLSPTTPWSDAVTKIHEQLVKSALANKLAKYVPALWTTCKLPDESNQMSNKQKAFVLNKMEEQVVDDKDVKNNKDISKDDIGETALSLIHAAKDFDYWVRMLLIQKKGLDSPIDWEVTIRTSRESFSSENEFCIIYTPGIFSNASAFSPLGYYRSNPNAPIPITVLNVNIFYPSLRPIEKGDPRVRSSSHLQGMWVKMAALAKQSPSQASATQLNMLPWMTDKEYTELLDVNSGVLAAREAASSCPLDPNERLIDIFASTVSKHSKRVAISSPAEGISMTYGEFDAKSTQLAHALRAAGVRGGNVSMMLPRSALMYVAIMGILKCGAAYVPIDPEYPADRVAYIVSDSDSHLLLTHSKLSIFFPTVVSHKEKNGDTDLSSPSELEELSNNLRDSLPPFTGKVWLLDLLMDGLISKQSTTTLECNSTSKDLAYIIYTSGSTGRPKGVQLENRNVCTLVRAERELYQATPNDVTWQGFSIAFDASVEELWLAWAAGGTLFCATHEMIHAGPALAGIWAEHKLTIVSTVPTLLTMLDDENLPHLRLLILGGEACHKDLVQKWSKGRRMINTYGPTEATVIATSADVRVSDTIVTIGKPIAHYNSYIVDPVTLRVCPKGVPGELLLGGPGLARGYVKRPELTDTVFINNPFRRPNSDDPERLYRTGDLTRWSEGNEIEFMGRIDAQVKLRGFRVELAEIESVLLQSQLILSAVCHILTVGGAAQLVAFIVPSNIASVPKVSSEDPNHPDNLPPLLTLQEETDLKEKLRIRLPPYMVPSIFETLCVIPTLPSGKANRKMLPAPRVRGAKNNASGAVPNSIDDFGFDDVKKEESQASNPMEKKILPFVCELFAQTTLPISANFFELGGHSVLVARLVSMLRKDPMTASATMADIYNNPTVQALAAHLMAKNGIEANPTGEKRENGYVSLDMPTKVGKEQYVPVNKLAYYSCWFAQTILLYCVWAVPAFMLLFAFKFFLYRIDKGDPWWGALLLTFPVISLFYPVMLILAILCKWILLGKVQPGKYPIWGFWFLRWWIVKKVTEFVPMDPLHGTIFLNWYYMLLGVNVGSHVYIGTTHLEGHDLISIDDDSSIGADATLEAYRVVQGHVVLGRIKIGKRCFVGNRSMIISSRVRDTVMEDDSQLAELSLLSPGSVIPAKQNWGGSPSRFASEVVDLPLALVLESRPHWFREVVFIIFKIVLFELLPWLLLAEVAPLFCVLYFNKNIRNGLGDRDWLYFLVIPMPTAVLSIISLMISLVIIKWIIIRKWTSTTIYLYSFDYLRKFIYDIVMGTVSSALHPVYSSLYFPPFLRALGANIGADTEISTATHFLPDLLVIGEGCFIADDVCLGAPVVHLNWMQVGKVQIGDRTFIGNSALLPINTVAGSNALVGAVSTGPRKANAVTLPDEAWLEAASNTQSMPPSMKQEHLTYAYEPISPRGGSKSTSLKIENTRKKRANSFDSYNVPNCEIPDHTNWFGSPSIRLPKRIDWTNKFDDASTFHPALYMRATRYIIEFFRIVIPLTFVITEFLLFIRYCDDILRALPYSNYPNPNSLLNYNLFFWPAVMIGSGCVSALIAFLFKWVLIGQYTVSDWPLWSTFVWRSELVVALCESLADPMICSSLRGTPWIILWLRLMGCKMGSYVYMDSLQITEFDLVEVGDEVTVGEDVTIQTHLFEDRICKMEQVIIGNCCSMGSLSVVLYSSRMEEGSCLSGRSLLMKNETLPAWTQWQGLPASPYVDTDM